MYLHGVSILASMAVIFLSAGSSDALPRTRAQYTIEVGNWKVNVSRNTDVRYHDPVLFVPHSDERIALQTAQDYINQFNGWVFAIDCNGQRTCHGADPNRQFRDNLFASGIFERLYHFKVFGATIAKIQDVITLHNNHGISLNRKYGAPMKIGGNSGRSYFHGGGLHDFILINGEDRFVEERAGSSSVFYPADSKARDFIEKMKVQGISVVYEYGSDDGSMSFEATRRGHRYFNVESAKAGSAAVQMRMLTALLKYLGY